MKVCLIISCLIALLFSPSYTFQFNPKQSKNNLPFDTIVVKKNLIGNGDFEQGNIDFTSEYTYITDTIYHGHYTVTSDIHEMNYKLTSHTEGDHTTGRGNYLVIDSKIFRELYFFSLGLSCRRKRKQFPDHIHYHQ